MGKRESFLLRTEPEVLDALRLWARDELRSVNAQIEFLLRRALRDQGRLSKDDTATAPKPDERDDAG